MRAGRTNKAHHRLAMLCCALALAFGAPFLPLAHAQGAAGETKPYDTRLMRLSELLGSIHYLRELCGADDGQLWRERMQELIAAEGSSALRRARLTQRFNRGYRSYSRTYTVCTESAQRLIERFFAEAVEITDAIAKIP